MRHTTPIFLTGAAAIALVLFTVKYEVQDLEEELLQVHREMIEDQRAIRVLKAEWSHLNEPGRLRELSEKHLGLAPVTPDRIATMEEIPVRPEEEGDGDFAAEVGRTLGDLDTEGGSR